MVERRTEKKKKEKEEGEEGVTNSMKALLA
jgi:hypothetical protein